MADMEYLSEAIEVVTLRETGRVTLPEAAGTYFERLSWQEISIFFGAF
jgi:hypothetical protein